MNFAIINNGSTKKFSQFIAQDAAGKLLATITPRLMATGKYSDRFLNVCFMDGSVEIADRQDGAHETDHASEIIAKKLFS